MRCSEDYFQPAIIDEFATDAVPRGGNQSDVEWMGKDRAVADIFEVFFTAMHYYCCAVFHCYFSLAFDFLISKINRVLMNE